jgi:hypothetical protein
MREREKNRASEELIDKRMQLNASCLSSLQFPISFFDVVTARLNMNDTKE